MANQDDHQPNAHDQQAILVAHMMTPGVVQIPGDVSVTEAASLLERERMPCLLIKDTESRFGLMTPTDIVKKVVAQGLEPDDIEVRTIMTRPVQFIEYDRVMDEASALMMSTGTPILIVTKQDQPVGVLTARDLVLSPKRCLTNISATISIIEGDGVGDEYQVAISQLSHAGASVETPAILLPGTKVILSFFLSEMISPLTIPGTVLNNARGQSVSSTTGSLPTAARSAEIQFVDLSPADQSRIKAWMLTNLPNSSRAS